MATTPHRPDPAQQRQRDILDRALRTLRYALPPPLEDRPEAWKARDRVALATVAAMRPANPVEARLAALHVATTAYASHCLRRLPQCADDPRREAQLIALAASMGREARGCLGTLLRRQAVRKKHEATAAAGRASAALAEQTLLALMTAALERMPPGPPARPAVPEADRHDPSRQRDRPQDPGRRRDITVAWVQSPPNPTIH